MAAGAMGAKRRSTRACPAPNEGAAEVAWPAKSVSSRCRAALRLTLICGCALPRRKRCCTPRPRVRHPSRPPTSRSSPSNQLQPRPASARPRPSSAPARRGQQHALQASESHAAVSRLSRHPHRRTSRTAAPRRPRQARAPAPHRCPLQRAAAMAAPSDAAGECEQCARGCTADAIVGAPLAPTLAARRRRRRGARPPSPAHTRPDGHLSLAPGRRTVLVVHTC